MALVSQSIDEATEELADIYDSLIDPMKIYRNHNNKLYLILRAFAGGKIGLNDVALALRNRFDPRYCDEIDLYSTAKIVGTDYRHGTGSIIDITVKNTSTEQKTFHEGIYNYSSTLGMLFHFQLLKDAIFEPEQEQKISAVSVEKGSWSVASNSSIKLFRSDSKEIDKAFTFSCDDNSNQLGYLDETPYEFRTRILNDTDRQDHLKELELKIRNLPNIFECNLVFNESNKPQTYDDIELLGKELLITITGVPTDEIAKLVAKDITYPTHMVDPENVVYYHNDLYINGKYPVYFKYHELTEFSISIEYAYDQSKMNEQRIDEIIREAFKPYTRTVVHIGIFGERDVYRILETLNLPAVTMLSVTVYNAEGEEVDNVEIPKTRIPRLTGITFTPKAREMKV
jgi:hypothetical protein